MSPSSSLPAVPSMLQADLLISSLSPVTSGRHAAAPSPLLAVPRPSFRGNRTSAPHHFSLLLGVDTVSELGPPSISTGARLARSQPPSSLHLPSRPSGTSGNLDCTSKLMLRAVSGCSVCVDTGLIRQGPCLLDSVGRPLPTAVPDSASPRDVNELKLTRVPAFQLWLARLAILARPPSLGSRRSCEPIDLPSDARALSSLRLNELRTLCSNPQHGSCARSSQPRPLAFRPLPDSKPT